MNTSSFLIVDDLVYFQEVYKEILTDSGYSCEIAVSVREAIEKLQKSSFDVAILDIRLDDEDPENLGGLEILQWLVDNDVNINVIICSAYIAVEVARMTILSDKKVVGVIRKISPLSEIISIINKAANKKQI